VVLLFVKDDRGRGGLSFVYLHFIEDALKAEGDQRELKLGFIGRFMKKPPGEFLTPAEASHDHFSVTLPSHFALRKTKG
jgi:hypothetical protein